MARRNLDRKRVIITGASSGIGWSLAVQLAQSGAEIVACARREDRLQQLTDQIVSEGGRCIPVVGDITDPVIRSQLIETCNLELGGLDLLINNAGIGAMGRFDEASADRLHQIFQVNFFAAVELIREAIPALKQGVDPMIVNLGSVLGHRAAPLKSEYCASKFAIHGFSDALRAELSADRIDVLLVSPSTTESEFFDQALEDKTGKNWIARGAMSPDVVAKKTIAAIRRGKHEIVLSTGGRLLVWFDRLMPGLADRLIARYGQ